jgi:hypothetical protein
MIWFNKNRGQMPPLSIQPPPTSRVEVELHKNASVEAAEQAKKANEHLNDLLVKNGFTLKIYLAAGGQPPKKRGGNK